MFHITKVMSEADQERLASYNNCTTTAITFDPNNLLICCLIKSPIFIALLQVHTIKEGKFTFRRNIVLQIQCLFALVKQHPVTNCIGGY